MEHYKIIADIEEVERFISSLPYNTEDEVYYLSLFARKKYAPDVLKSKLTDRIQLARFTSKRDDIVRKIKKLEIPLGSYVLKGVTVPQEALVLYINVNHRSVKKATKYLAKKCIDLLDSTGYSLEIETLSALQKSKSFTYRVDFDIDDDLSEKYIEDISNTLDENSYQILKTRGGFHLMVDPTKQSSKKWYQEIIKLLPVDKNHKSDNMIPFPGTYQGGFVPKFIKI